MARDLSAEPRILRTPSFYGSVPSTRVVQWYLDGTNASRRTVGLYLPRGFDAYVQIPHPKWMAVPEGTPGSISYHGCWRKPVGIDSEEEAFQPDEGQLIGPWAAALFETLQRASSAPDLPCFCGLWGGYSAKDRPATARFWIRTDLDFLLYTAPLDVIGGWLSTHRVPDPMNIPSILWPEDRRWCVATPFDEFCTYVAGANNVIEQLLMQRDVVDIRVVSLDQEI